MATVASLHTLSEELGTELTERILPYWITNTPDRKHGGFVGAIDGQSRVVPGAEKGAVLNARILWTFAASARLLNSQRCRDLADRAYGYLADRFWDSLHGGVYWALDSEGHPTQPKKHVYAQAFALYAFSEYYRATAQEESLERARRIFELLEDHAHDSRNGGYAEAFRRDWTPLDDVSLGESDPNEEKSMNTALHVLEAFTNLYRVWPAERVRDRLTELVDIFLYRIVDRETYHLRCFFDEAWTPRSSLVSFGHDIEASWLLREAAEEIGASALKANVESLTVPMVDAVLRGGMGNDHGLMFEAEGPAVTDTDRHWWPQAEALVGFVNAYQCSGEDRFLEAARKTWSFIEEKILDRTYGEWYYRVSEDGEPYPSDGKVGFWKGPYHNARACLEIKRRASEGPVRSVDHSAKSDPSK